MEATGLSNNRAICVEGAITVGCMAVSSSVPSTLFKYMYTTHLVGEGSRAILEERPTVSEFDNYLYHGGLLLLFKGVLGGTYFDHEAFLTLLSSPRIQKMIVESPKFQDLKRSFAIQMLTLLADRKMSVGKKIAIAWVKSYLNSTHLKHLIKDVDISLHPTSVLELVKYNIEDKIQGKIEVASRAVDEVGDVLRSISQGVINSQAIDVVCSHANSLMKEVDLSTAHESVSLLTLTGMAQAVGELSLHTLAGPFAIARRTSKYPSLAEGVLRAAGVSASLVYKGITPVLLTEIALVCMPKSFGYGDELSIPRAQRALKVVYLGLKREVQSTYSVTPKEFLTFEKATLEALIGAGMFMYQPDLHPAIHALTNRHMITALAGPIDGNLTEIVSVQLISAFTLSFFDLLGGQGVGKRVVLNGVAIVINNPRLMNNFLKMTFFQEGKEALRTAIPGLSYIPYIKLLKQGFDQCIAHSPPLSRIYNGTKLAIGIGVVAAGTKCLGRIENVKTVTKNALMTSLAFYLNNSVFTSVSTVLGSAAGIVAVAYSASDSNIARGVGVGVGALVYSATASPALTALSITAVNVVSETTIPSRLRAAATRFLGF